MKEMTNLLSEVMYLFDDNYADLTELLEFRDEMLSAMLLGMDKCVLDLRDIAEIALNEEHEAKNQLDLLHSELLKARDQLSEKQQFLDGQSFRMNNELTRLETLVGDLEAENDELHRVNRKLSGEISQNEKQLRKYYSQEDYIRSLEDKIDAAEKQNEDLIQINADLQRDKHALLDDNKHLVEEHNRILSDSKSARDASGDLQKRLINTEAKLRGKDDELEQKEREIDDLIERQTKANDDVATMISDSKRLLEQANLKNSNLESECLRLKEDLEKTFIQNNELRGLMEMYKEKYKAEKLNNRNISDQNLMGVFS